MESIAELYDRVNSALAAEAAKREKTLVGMSNARASHRSKVASKQAAPTPKKERGLFDDDSVYARMQDTPEGQRGSYENQLPEPQETPRADSSKKSAFNDSLSMKDVDAIVASRKSADPQDVTRIAESKKPVDTSRDVEMIIATERSKAPEKKATKMVNMLDKVQAELKMEPTIFPKSGSLSDMARAPIPESMKAPSSKAAEAPSRDLNSLFKMATGTSFDPNSRVDRVRRAELQDLISSRPDLADKSDTKVALAWYASKKK